MTSPRPRLRKIEAAGALAAIVAIGLVAFADAPVARLFAASPAGLLRPAVWITTVTEPVALLIAAMGLGFAVTAWRRRGASTLGRRDPHAADPGLHLVAVTIGAGLTALALKHGFGRAAPPLLDIVGPFHFDMFVFDADFASFPSVPVAMLVAAAAALRSGRVASGGLGIAATMTALAQGVVGAAYLSDIAAGAAIGLGWALLWGRGR